MVPIRDASGSVIGFGGRILPTDCSDGGTIVPTDNGKAAKYVNSPSTSGESQMLSMVNNVGTLQVFWMVKIEISLLCSILSFNSATKLLLQCLRKEKLCLVWI